MAQNASPVTRLIRSGYGIAFIFVLALAGCTNVQRYLSGEGPPPFRTFYSPNGEVLNGGPLGKPSCSDAMTAWFNRTDSNHDGRLTREEFFADARRLFAIMDLDHDGVITPAELDRYRDPFSPPPEQRSTNRNDRNRNTQNRGRDSLTAGDTPDPVMSSDVRLRNVVDLQDYLIHAEKVFASLDKKRDGALDLRETVDFCKEQEPR
jgi:Ca2+-binding EF-hand superfamily protein